MSESKENKEAPEVPIQEQVKDKTEKFILSYVEFMQKSIDDAISGKSVNKDTIYAMGDAIRVMHHIKQITDTPTVLSK